MTSQIDIYRHLHVLHLDCYSEERNKNKLAKDVEKIVKLKSEMRKKARHSLISVITKEFDGHSRLEVNLRSMRIHCH